MAVNTTKVEHSWQPGAAMAAEPLADLSFDDAAHLVVEHVDHLSGERTTLQRDADYEVTVPSGSSWGTVRALAAYPDDDWFYARRSTPRTQEKQFSPFDVKAKSIEDMGDRAMRIAQEQAHELDRAVKFERGADPVEVADLSGMVDGDLLEFRDGKLRKADFMASAGMFAAFSALGLLVGVGGALPGEVPALAENIATADGADVQAELDTIRDQLGPGGINAVLARLPVWGLSYAPSEAVADAVVAGTHNADTAAWLTTAANAAVAAGRALMLPAGTFPLIEWTPPAGLTLITAGKETVFKQLDTAGVPKRIITIAYDGIRLWPGGAATIDGSMNVHAGNATEFNAGVFVDPADGVTIKSFVMGDVYGRHIGGDVFCTYDGGTGYLHHFDVGVIYGFNCYRTVAAITAGRSGRIKAVIDQGMNAGEGTGIGALFIEHDATINSPVGDLDIGHVRGRIMNIVGVPLGARVGSIRIGSVDLDANRPFSNPAYDEAGLNIGTTPYLFNIGIAYREVDNFYIGSAKIANCPWDAIRDNGEASVNWSRRAAIGALEIVNCGGSSGREVALQRTRSFTVGEYKSTAKPTISTPSFLGGQVGGQISVDALEVVGRFATVACDIRIRDGSINSNEEHLFYYSTGGQIDLDNIEITGTAVSLFLGATKVPTLKNCHIANAPGNFLGAGGDAAPNARLTNVTIGAVTYGDRFYTPLPAVGDPAGGATIDAEARAAINAILDRLGVSGMGLTQDA